MVRCVNNTGTRLVQLTHCSACRRVSPVLSRLAITTLSCAHSCTSGHPPLALLHRFRNRQQHDLASPDSFLRCHLRRRSTGCTWSFPPPTTTTSSKLQHQWNECSRPGRRTKTSVRDRSGCCLGSKSASHTITVSFDSCKGRSVYWWWRGGWSAAVE